MKLDSLRENKELLPSVLLIVSLLSAVLILIKVTGFFVDSDRAVSAAKVAIRHSQPDEKNLRAQLDKSKQVAEALKKSNLFSPPAPRQNPIKAVLGILGDEALINGKWYKAGDKVGDAKILAVNATSVETEWEGKKITFGPIDGGVSSGPSKSSRSGQPGSIISSSSPRASLPGMVVTQGSKSEAKDQGEGPLVWDGMARDLMSMSEAERTKYKERMGQRLVNMSESEREEFTKRMQGQFIKELRAMSESEREEFNEKLRNY